MRDWKARQDSFFGSLVEEGDRYMRARERLGLDKQRIYSYKITVKPQEKVKLIYPYPTDAAVKRLLEEVNQEKIEATGEPLTKREEVALEGLFAEGSLREGFWPGLECVNVLVIRARPTTWKDFSFSSSAKPLEKDPFEDLE